MSVIKVVLARLKNFIGPESATSAGYVGKYDSWLQAKGESLGYQDPVIAKRVASAVCAVMSGAAAYERDSITFSSREFSFPVATALLWAASKYGGALRVLDYGGGLGTSFFQNKPFMRWVTQLEWGIVEQQSFVAQGNEVFAGQQPKFYSSIERGLESIQPQLVLLSSSLQYVEKPFDVLAAIALAKVEVVVIDRTLFSREMSDFVTRQHVPASIFPAVIPTWIFGQQKFMNFMAKDYRLVSKFQASQTTVNLDREKRGLEELGLMFVLKGSDYDQALDIV